MNRKILIGAALLLLGQWITAAVKLPAYVTDNMLVQRETPVRLYGWADRGETVAITLNGKTVKTRADKDGLWKASLKALPVGGPYEMTVKGKKNEIKIKNIMSGDLWICSGQSNMEWRLAYGIVNKDREIAEANYPNIRLLTVNKNMAAHPQTDINTDGWKECSPQSVTDFSAVAYFFGRELYKSLNIPIGLINTSWGGTDIETWMSLDSIRRFPQYKQQVKEASAPDFSNFLRQPANPKDRVAEDPGLLQSWEKNSSKVAWDKVTLPSLWSAADVTGPGVGWYRKTFTLTEKQASAPADLVLGFIDDDDETWLNGQKIGATAGSDKYRSYRIESGLKKGTNELIVRVIDWGGAAGFSTSPELRTAGGNISLTGTWDFKISTLWRNIGPNAYPSLLYNAMIAPLTNYPVKGVIWYQGENNSWAGYRYRSLFPAMINCWRAAWKQPDMPFYFVQLANFTAPAQQPGNSEWAELREAQHRTLSLPNTGEAVTIDIGEANDIHPKNKQDVGYRLALNALAKTYGKKIEYSGPEYRSMKIDGNRVILNFDHTDKGLVARSRYGYLCGFAIAGNDRQWHWAKAQIEGNRVIVSSDRVPSPVAVRYAWANNPDDANLYNTAGLPASPFRTDDWEGVTKK